MPAPTVHHVVIHRPGPAWLPGTDFREQPGVLDHVLHYRAAHERGLLVLGGPFLGQDVGGMMIAAPSVTREELEAIASSDPAVASGLLTAEVRAWYTPMGSALG